MSIKNNSSSTASVFSDNWTTLTHTDNGTYSFENNGKVKFDFKHQLSKVAFKLTNGIGGNSLEIKDFVINSVSTTGKATIKGNAIEFEVSVTAWGDDTEVKLNDITA